MQGATTNRLVAQQRHRQSPRAEPRPACMRGIPAGRPATIIIPRMSGDPSGSQLILGSWTPGTRSAGRHTLILTIQGGTPCRLCAHRRRRQGHGAECRLSCVKGLLNERQTTYDIPQQSGGPSGSPLTLGSRMLGTSSAGRHIGSLPMQAATPCRPHAQRRPPESQGAESRLSCMKETPAERHSAIKLPKMSGGPRGSPLILGCWTPGDRSPGSHIGILAMQATEPCRLSALRRHRQSQGAEPRLSCKTRNPTERPAAINTSRRSVDV